MNKLEFIDVEFRNFLSYGKIPQRITFTPGINLILGMDEERNRSNAAGKSSLMETISFALFGRLNRNVKKDQIVNWKNRKNCEVTLRFKKDNNIYRVTRGIKPDKLEIYRDDVLIPPLSDVRIYQKQFENEIIGMDFNTFVSIIHTNLNSLTPILKMDSAKKRAFLERVFGLEIYSKINDKANIKIKSINDTIYKTKLEIDYDKKRYDELHGQLSTLKSKLGDMTTSIGDLESVKKHIELLGFPEEKISNIDREINDLKHYIETNTTTKGTLDIALARNIAYKDNLVREITQILLDKEKSEKYNEAVKKYDLLTNTYGTPIELASKVALLASELVIIEDDISQLNQSIGITSGVISGHIDNIKELQKRLKELGNKCLCPTCGSELSSTNIVGSLTDQIKELSNKIIFLNNTKDKYNKLIDDRTNKKNEIKAENLNINKAIKEITDANTEMSKYEDYNLFNLKLDEQNKQLEDICEAIEELKASVTKLEGNIKLDKSVIINLTVDLEQFKKDMKTLKELEVKQQVLQERVDQEAKTKQEVEDTIENIANERIGLIKNIRTNESKTDKLNDIIDYLEYTRVLCKDDNVKQFAISSIMPFLTRQVNHYLAEGGCNFYLKFSGWLDEEICGPGITDCSYGNLSGGEARSIDLALQLSFLDVARLQATTFPDIIVFDEILDSSIDATGLENLLKIIRAKQKEDDSKVFLITHRSEVSDLDVETSYTIKKIEGYSQVSIT